MNDQIHKFGNICEDQGITISTRGDNFMTSPVGVFTFDHTSGEMSFSPNCMVPVELITWVALTVVQIAKEVGFTVVRPAAACWALDPDYKVFETDPVKVTEHVNNHQLSVSMGLAKDMIKRAGGKVAQMVGSTPDANEASTIIGDLRLGKKVIAPEKKLILPE